MKIGYYWLFSLIWSFWIFIGGTKITGKWYSVPLNPWKLRRVFCSIKKNRNKNAFNTHWKFILLYFLSGLWWNIKHDIQTLTSHISNTRKSVLSDVKTPRNNIIRELKECWYSNTVTSYIIHKRKCFIWYPNYWQAIYQTRQGAFRPISKLREVIHLQHYKCFIPGFHLISKHREVIY